jgi:uncharacterized cupin superfamily protein
LNLFDAPVPYDDSDPEGYRNGRLKIGPQVGASKIGGSIWELPPGQATCPYHWESPNEEWVIVLSGTPTLRTPEGERALEPGEVVCFPVGPDGAHKLVNRTDETVRILLLSTMITPDMAFYPDSDKLGMFGIPDREAQLFRASSSVDYYDGEA